MKNLTKDGFKIRSLCLTAMFLAFAPTAQARELEGRLGVGYNSEFAATTPAGISLKYGLSRDLAVEIVGGISTATPTGSVFAVKAFKNVFLEPHLNFYFVGGLGLLTAPTTTTTSSSGMVLLAGFGMEFFIPGVESLGLSVESGITFDNTSGSYAIKTLGVSFLNAGIHFYF